MYGCYLYGYGCIAVTCMAVDTLYGCYLYGYEYFVWQLTCMAMNTLCGSYLYGYGYGPNASCNRSVYWREIVDVFS